MLVDNKYEATGALGENKKRKLKFDKLTLGGLDENNGGMIGCIEEVKINQILIQDLLHYDKLRITKKQEVLDQWVFEFVKSSWVYPYLGQHEVLNTLLKV